MQRLPAPLAKLSTFARTKYFDRGETVLYQGDTTQDVYYVAEGRIKIYEIDSQGNEKIVHILQPGAFFPIVYFFQARKEIPWFYSALTDAAVQAIPYDDFKRGLCSDPDYMTYFMNQVALEIHELRVRIESMSRATTLGKVASALKFLEVYHCEPSRGPWRRVAFPVSHQLLADMVGTTRESVTLAMGQLQADKIVRYPALTILEMHVDRLIALEL